ncbi:Isocitrate dehydrogenase [NADP] [Capsicum baccatum]|uniref:Isocitrate dehydrogenase [NADP] n=1 Tax=Capsicum baccatum TaxID=33114 RepID=A0A2G2VEM4_CAPBA|nr:Isocitrate dehydrogenase [NADP] [Capsicum baccatum]
MTKSTRSNDNSPTEMGELRELMQKLISEIGVLNGAAAKLKNLNQTVMELKEQLEGIRKDTTPTGGAIETSGERLSRETIGGRARKQDPLGYQQGIARYSKLDFPRFSGEDVLDEMPKRDLYVDFLESSTVDINNETEEIEDLFLDVFYRDTESDVDALEDWSLDKAPSIEDKSNKGDFGGFVLDVLLIENENKVFATSLNSEEVNSNEDKLVKTRNKKDMEAGAVGLFMHFQLSPRTLRKPVDMVSANEKEKHNGVSANPWELGAEKLLFLRIDERPILIAWDVIGNKKVMMLRMRMYDHTVYLVNCHIATHLGVIDYQFSSSYFTLENKGDLDGKGCTQFPLLQFSAPSFGKTSSTSFEQNMENRGRQLFMLFQSLGPSFGDEMTRVIWKLIKDKLILPFVELDIKYFDLGFPHRDATDDKVGQNRYALADMATDIVIQGAGKLKLVFVPEGTDQKIEFEVCNFTGAGGVALSMYNTDESIRSFAEASMNMAYQKKWPLCLSTKNTILKKYDGRFKDIFQEVYESNWKLKFEEAGI